MEYVEYFKNANTHIGEYTDGEKAQSVLRAVHIHDLAYLYDSYWKQTIPFYKYCNAYTLLEPKYVELRGMTRRYLIFEQCVKVMRFALQAPELAVVEMSGKTPDCILNVCTHYNYE